MPECDLLLVNAAELATPMGEPPFRGARLGRLRVVRDAAVALRAGRIAAVGTRAELADWDGARVVDCGGGTILPGFVDAHTHLVWAGERVHELALKLEGASYQELLAAGGTIHATVDATRKAPANELVRVARERLDRCLAQGTTTLEAKSGYALTLDGELALLRALRALDDHPVDVMATLLGAHAVPRDAASRKEFLDMVCDELTPRVAKEELAVFCDAFVDEGAFSVDEGRAVLEAGLERGLEARLHADELACTRATRMGIDVGAVSLDHLNRVHTEDLRDLGDDENCAATATLCPVTPFTSGIPYPPARELVAAGAAVALGADMNPNAWSEGMLFTIALAVHALRLKPSEAITAATANAAWSLGLIDRGRLETGLVGDLVVLDMPRHEYVGYRLGGSPVRCVVKAGRVVAGA